ncbi:MAG: hypothetical protein PHD67_10050 [Oscillospiraceae bacterium]|nr:hypothetical protein [Oscillospiraceae bacterium]
MILEKLFKSRRIVLTFLFRNDILEKICAEVCPDKGEKWDSGAKKASDGRRQDVGMRESNCTVWQAKSGTRGVLFSLFQASFSPLRRSRAAALSFFPSHCQAASLF